jgi:hypothetical protein
MNPYAPLVTPTRRARGFWRFLRGDRSYVLSRGVSLFLALSFALIYSKQLGVERRGLLTFVMTTNLVFSILLVSGISLHLRNQSRVTLVNSVLGGYVFLVVLFSLFTPILNYTTLLVYQDIFGVSIPSNLVITSMLYCFFSTFNFGIYDALILAKLIKVVSMLDISTILIQIVVYFLLLFIGETSFFVSVLIAIITSYLVTGIASLTLLLSQHKQDMGVPWKKIGGLFRGSLSSYIVNITGSLLERLDKVYLGLLTTPTDLGRYSTNQSFFSLSRFIPDSLSKLTIARDRGYLAFRRSTSRLLLIAASMMLVVTWLIHKLVDSQLGQDWMIPFWLLFSLGAVEFLRGVFLITSMNAVRLNANIYLSRVLKLQLLLALSLQPLLIGYFEITGAIIGSALILMIGLVSMRKYIRA